MHVTIVNFRLNGIDEQQYASLCDQIAPAFAAVPGLISKVWIKNETGTYGGVYVWESRAAYQRYMESDLFKTVLSHPNLADISAKDFEILEGPTRVTHGLLTAVA